MSVSYSCSISVHSNVVTHFSSYNNLDSTSEENGENCDLGRSLTPNERSHSRSKSVRGLQDLAGELRKTCDQNVHQKIYLLSCLVTTTHYYTGQSLFYVV